MKVSDIMTPPLFTAPEDLTVSQMAKVMLAATIHRLIVTRENKVVGVVSTMDILKVLAGNDGKGKFRGVIKNLPL